MIIPFVVESKKIQGAILVPIGLILISLSAYDLYQKKESVSHKDMELTLHFTRNVGNSKSATKRYLRNQDGKMVEAVDLVPEGISIAFPEKISGSLYLNDSTHIVITFEKRPGYVGGLDIVKDDKGRYAFRGHVCSIEYHQTGISYATRKTPRIKRMKEIKNGDLFFTIDLSFEESAFWDLEVEISVKDLCLNSKAFIKRHSNIRFYEAKFKSDNCK